MVAPITQPIFHCWPKVNRLSHVLFSSPARRGFFISEFKMQNKFQISFYENSQGVTVGSLSIGHQKLLDTTHPATIAYALQAMNAESVEITHESTSFEIPLPGVMLMSRQLESLGQHAHWVSHFLMFSQIDSFNPPAIDDRADIHLRTAIHFLPIDEAVGADSKLSHRAD
jgi:hypothetical protein